MKVTFAANLNNSIWFNYKIPNKSESDSTERFYGSIMEYFQHLERKKLEGSLPYFLITGLGLKSHKLKDLR